MTTLNQIININISRQTKTVQKQSFGVMLFVAEFATFTDRIRYYTSTDGMISDGFATGDMAYKMAAAAFSAPNPPTIVGIGRKITGSGADADWPSALTAIRAVDDSWYGLCISSVTAADIEAVSAYVEPNLKLFCGLSGDAGYIDIASTTDVASVLKNAAYDRSFTCYHPTPAANREDCAWMGQQLVKQPGSTTWFAKTLPGIAAYVLTDTQSSAAIGTPDGSIVGKNGNIYQTVGGNNIMLEGVVASGEYIDVIQFVDYLQSDLQARLFSPMINSEKVPFTDPGIVTFENQLRGGLENGITVGGLSNDPPYSIVFPTRDQTSSDDRGHRRLTGCTFSAPLAGAIHYVQVNGTVTL